MTVSSGHSTTTAGDVALELRALAFMANLRTRGFQLIYLPGDVFGVVVEQDLTEQDRALVTELQPTIIRLLREGNSGELFQPPADLAEWLAGLHPFWREFSMYLARRNQRYGAGELGDCLRRVRVVVDEQIKGAACEAGRRGE